MIIVMLKRFHWSLVKGIDQFAYHEYEMFYLGTCEYQS